MKRKRLTIEEAYFIFNIEIDRITKTPSFQKMKEYMQHGSVTTYEHSIAVAFYSMKLALKLNLKIDYHSLIRGALLHDYFQYDWHDRSVRPKCHGFKHPFIALKNAELEYSLNKKEKDIILKHMFPLTLIPPLFKESYIVSIVDKYCSSKETANKNYKYKNVPNLI